MGVYKTGVSDRAKWLKNPGHFVVKVTGFTDNKTPQGRTATVQTNSSRATIIRNTKTHKLNPLQGIGQTHTT